MLAARVKNIEENKVIFDILEKVFKRNVDSGQLFTLSEKTSPVMKHEAAVRAATVQQHSHTLPSHSAWTFDMSMSRFGVLLCQAWSHKEPVMQAG